MAVSRRFLSVVVPGYRLDASTPGRSRFFVCFSFRGPLSRPFCEIVGQLRDPQRVQQPDLQPGALPGSGSLEPVPLQGRRRPRDWNAISRSRPTLTSLDHGLNGSRQVENGNRDRKSAMQK